MNKIYNFSPGPSKLPEEVIKNANKAITGFEKTNYSILEIAHRSKEFEDIIESIKSNLHFLLSIPTDYEILLLQGGATFQNSLLAYNIPTDSSVGCLVNGEWGKKTFNDFSKVLKKVKKFEISYPQMNSLFDSSFSGIDFLHITSNETIDGIQIRNIPKIKNSNLIVDMSSDIGSYKISFENIKYIYAGAQKNLGIPGVTLCIIKKDFLIENDNPTYLNLNELSQKNSLLNTPPTFSIYLLKLVLDWMVELGGLNYFEKKSINQSNLIYDFLDSNKNIFTLLEKSEFRSRSNITFNFINNENTNKFLHYAEEQGIIGINGHRSVGGVRISLYNSITDEMVSYLVDHIEMFLRKL